MQVQVRTKLPLLRVRFHIIRNARIENVGKSQSCMVSKLRIIWKQTVLLPRGRARWSQRFVRQLRPFTRSIKVRLHPSIIRNARIKNVGKSQSRMASKLLIICM